MSKNTPNAVEIIRTYLETHGFDGLYNSAFECACVSKHISDCEIFPAGCQPGHLVEQDEQGDYCIASPSHADIGPTVKVAGSTTLTAIIPESTAVERITAMRKRGVHIDAVDGKEFIGQCELCNALIMDGDTYESDPDGIITCSGCAKQA